MNASKRSDQMAQHATDQAAAGGSHAPLTKLPLAEQVARALDDYFRHLDGHSPSDLHALVMGEVERPLLAAVVAHTEGNLTRAAEYLGMNRATLRNKLKKYGIEN